LAAGGDPNPGLDFVSPPGYRLGLALAKARRGEARLGLRDEQWRELGQSGVLRHTQGAIRLIAELTQHVKRGGDSNPRSSVTTPAGYPLGRQLYSARIGKFPVTDEEWADLEQLGARRLLSTSPGVAQ
jgi:hypothetical protein